MKSSEFQMLDPTLGEVDSFMSGGTTAPMQAQHKEILFHEGGID